MNAKLVKATTLNRKELGKVLPLETPFTLHIYPSNVCNFKCVFCTHSERPDSIKNETLDFDLYKKCIDELKGFRQKLKLLVLAGLGEPLLHPQIVEMIRYAKNADIADTVRIITNASLLTPQISDGLIEAGLDHLKISIYGVSDEQYYGTCNTKLGIDRIVRNVEYFYKNKKKTIVNVKTMDELIKEPEERERFFELFGNIADEINIEYIQPYQEVNHSKFEYNPNVTQLGNTKERNKICTGPFYFYELFPDGEIVPCFIPLFESYKELSIGNARDINICEAWTSKKMNQFRIMHLEEKRRENKTCVKCDEYYTCMCQPGDNIDAYKEKLLEDYRNLLGGGNLIG